MMSFVFVFSYDTWLSTGEVDGDVEEPPSADRPWKVSSAENTHSCFSASSSPCQKSQEDEEDGLADPRSVLLRFTPSGF